jgi:hypothetical protein
MFSLVRKAFAFKQELYFVIMNEKIQPMNETAIEDPLDPAVCSSLIFFPIRSINSQLPNELHHSFCSIIPFDLTMRVLTMCCRSMLARHSVPSSPSSASPIPLALAEPLFLRLKFTVLSPGPRISRFAPIVPLSIRIECVDYGIFKPVKFNSKFVSPPAPKTCGEIQPEFTASAPVRRY